MNYYFNEIKPRGDLFKRALRVWVRCFWRCWWLALCSITLTACSIYLPISLFILRPSMMLAYVLTLANVIVWLLMLQRVHHILSGANDQSSAYKRVMKRLPHSIGALVLALIATAAVMDSLLFLGVGLGPHVRGHMMLEHFAVVLLAFPTLYCCGLFVYAPLLAQQDNLPFYKAFGRSCVLSYRFWFRPFVVYALLLFAVMYPYATWHLMLLGKYSESVMWGIDALVSVLVFPWIVAVAQLALNDLKLRRAKYEAFRKARLK